MKIITYFKRITIFVFVLLQTHVSFASSSNDTCNVQQKIQYKFTERGLIKIKEFNNKTKELVVFKPEILFKGKYEVIPQTGSQRFSIRNARIGMSGNISSYLQYKFQLDLDSDGILTVLDIYAKITPVKGLEISFGQFSLPIFNSYTVSPGLLDFANKPFIGKYITSTRDIGVDACYTIKQKGFPIGVEAGIFNGNGINNYKWTKSIAYVGKIFFGHQNKGFRATIKAMKIKENSECDYAIWGLDSRYEMKNFKIEAEVMGKYNNYDNNHLFSYYIQSLYSFPINSNFIRAIQPALRWDSMGNNLRKEGLGVNRLIGVSRLTGGVNFALKTAPFNTILRLNYEQYFNYYQMKSFSNQMMNSNKFTLELLLSF